VVAERQMMKSRETDGKDIIKVTYELDEGQCIPFGSLYISRRNIDELSRLYRAVGSGFGVFQGLLQRSQGDQLLVDVQALNVNYALSFKGREGNGR